MTNDELRGYLVYPPASGAPATSDAGHIAGCPRRLGESSACDCDIRRRPMPSPTREDLDIAARELRPGECLEMTVARLARERDIGRSVVAAVDTWIDALHGRRWADATRALDALAGIRGVTMHTRPARENE